mmetsp:Transcript_12128/g.28534  ORF Transcript_12128/g.28534 Transcript_12128/m.28534 type:complete len:288 (-) Transcript_12128:505-1368(-)
MGGLKYWTIKLAACSLRNIHGDSRPHHAPARRSIPPLRLVSRPATAPTSAAADVSHRRGNEPAPRHTPLALRRAAAARPLRRLQGLVVLCILFRRLALSRPAAAAPRSLRRIGGVLLRRLALGRLAPARPLADGFGWTRGPASLGKVLLRAPGARRDDWGDLEAPARSAPRRRCDGELVALDRAPPAAAPQARSTVAAHAHRLGLEGRRAGAPRRGRLLRERKIRERKGGGRARVERGVAYGRRRRRPRCRPTGRNLGRTIAVGALPALVQGGDEGRRFRVAGVRDG